MMICEQNLLKFVPFISQVDPSFWQRLTEIKLEKDKLNEKVHKIWGYYSNRKPEGQNQLFSVDASSFNQLPDENRLFGVGSIINKNTIEGFKDENKIEIIKNEGKLLMNLIRSEAIKNPCVLLRFHIFTFANLKNYEYYYWFAFPVPKFLMCNILNSPQKIEEVFNAQQMQVLNRDYNSLLNSHNKGFFFVEIKKNNELKLVTVKEGISAIQKDEGEWILGFSDTSSCDFPSWPLRNFITFVAYHCSELVKNPLKVICLRQDFFKGQWRISHSIVLNIQIIIKKNSWPEDDWVGWEKNEQGKMKPRLANMKLSMDPLHLAETSVDLNLKLIKWQILPTLDLEKVKQAKCLLFGAGTLGCIVARNLMSWGVRHITFVDHGVISYSNLVRQFLYKFTDVGKSKAETAAAAIKEIFPGMVSSGFSFTIPMPGHPVCESMIAETQKNVQIIAQLIEDHDVTFLLLDSRESRWLPTVLATSKEKLVINAALGFDSYLVMRHGQSHHPTLNQGEESLTSTVSSRKLGCYFCNDVTAPGNSLKNRTLDQQCTVTRPGVSNIAGALAVELLVSILQHPQAGLAPAETNQEFTNTETGLGIIPHSIRGFISHYQTLLPATEAFESCVACSEKVVGEYQKKGFEFILKTLESKDYLEDFCGLTILQNESLVEEVLDFSDSESSDS